MVWFPLLKYSTLWPSRNLCQPPWAAEILPGASQPMHHHCNGANSVAAVTFCLFRGKNFLFFSLQPGWAYFLIGGDDMLWLLIFFVIHAVSHCKVKSWPRLADHHDSMHAQSIQDLVCLAAALFRPSTRCTEVADLGVSPAGEGFSEQTHLRLICKVRGSHAMSLWLVSLAISLLGNQEVPSLILHSCGQLV